MSISGTTDVLEQRCVVDVAYILLVESQVAGESGSEETRAGSLFGRLAHTQIGDLREGSDQLRKPQLGDGVLLSVCATSSHGGSAAPPLLKKDNKGKQRALCSAKAERMGKKVGRVSLVGQASRVREPGSRSAERQILVESCILTSENSVKRKFNFGETPKGEVRRTLILRTRVNKGERISRWGILAAKRDPCP
jgi:hypothetical protein